MQYWKKINFDEQRQQIADALSKNIDYQKIITLGVPGSKLDGQVFYDQATFLKEAPFLQSIVQNPNHIGCHTLGDSEPYFAGTQEIEREVIKILSEDILKAESNSCDGYIATGGTEANIQACWMYRNLFTHEYNARLDEIVLIASEDTHYSVHKASNLLQIDFLSIPVQMENRTIIASELDNLIAQAKQNGKKYAIVISNVGTTMFGSVDNPDEYAAVLAKHGFLFKIHMDAAFGGFIYPIVQRDNNIGFDNPHVSSVTLDAHKMLQAPYGTGVFLSRKGLIQHVLTKEAKYVNGMDITLSGSRSGANAIAVWMILQTYGPHGWLEKLNTLLYRTTVCCTDLDQLGIRYYRNPQMNIITIRASDIPSSLVQEFGLVPDSHGDSSQWYKIVVMDHVQIDVLKQFTEKLSAIIK
ncbi:MAG: aspartate aminotransferase family protein [Sphingobacterium sp.]|jgi:glutamate/tyrosine decarboxylase-like PLP-dependent enzyme|uniref:Pyridoxal phosphate-dependent decarboxylase family protein n=1 Tax=Sphingobacterium tabacisoli TaxID=2044855 RepID=A0ABW5LAT6_9SPHI|nr:pyridoxal-dependent decarboxylase [Sphingobacterium tabacisoli]MDR2282249.1 aspartate aminotransferase family protein [Sphingobacterium sp.]